MFEKNILILWEVKMLFNENMSVEEQLNEIFDEDFFSVLNIICGQLNKKDGEYRKAIDKCIEILDKNKRVRLVCDMRKPVPLSKNDVKLLIKYMDAEEEENLAYQKDLLCMGFRIAYMVFDKAGMLRK